MWTDTEDIILTDINRRNALSAQPDQGEEGEGRLLLHPAARGHLNHIFVMMRIEKPSIIFIAAVSGGWNNLNSSSIKNNNLEENL